MKTPEEEGAQTPTNPDDRASIADLMKGVPDDGFAAPKAETEPEGGESTPEVEITPEGTQGEAAGSEEAAAGSVATTSETEPSAAETTDSPQDDYEREVEAIQAPKGASERTTAVLKILKDKNKLEHRARKALEAEKAEFAKKELLDDGTKQELSELRRIRDTLAVEQSPAFKEYDTRVATHEQDAIALLRQWKLPEETAKYINDNGGLTRFQASDQLMPPGVQVDGKAATQAQWWNKVVKPMLSDAQREELSDHLSDARRAMRERNAALQKAKGNPQEFLLKEQERFDAQIKDFRDKADNQAQLEADLYGEIAKPREHTKDATPEQRADVDKHNARLASAKQDAVRWINDQSPEAQMSKALARVYRDFAQERVKELEVNNKDLQTKLNELQGKWDAARKSKETSRQQSTVQQQKPREEARKYDAGTSIRELMEQVPA